MNKTNKLYYGVTGTSEKITGRLNALCVRCNAGKLVEKGSDREDGALHCTNCNYCSPRWTWGNIILKKVNG